MQLSSLEAGLMEKLKEAVKEGKINISICRGRVSNIEIYPKNMPGFDFKGQVGIIRNCKESTSSTTMSHT